MEPKIINNRSMRYMQLFMRDRVIDKDVVTSVTQQNNIMLSKKTVSKEDINKHVIASIEFSDDAITFMAAFYEGEKQTGILRNVVNPIPSADDILPPETAFDFLIVQFMGFGYEKLHEIYKASKNGYRFGYDVVK